MHQVYVFDAYGTLFDVHAAVRRYKDDVGPDADQLSAIWRQKQLEYSWVRSLAGRYRDFWALTEDALDTAFRSVPSAPRTMRETLLDAYRELDAYPEVIDVLTQLREAGAKTAILSNGNQAMLELAVRGARIGGLLDDILSVDPLEVYKPLPAVYELVTTRFRLFPEAVSFQSSNRWDIAGATAFGFRTVWINRGGAPDEYADMAPAVTLSSLTGLATV
ncbi:haloacid dehalogenase type II [Acuticoccus sp. I52.16.1]|uniref:haloacid dehalogenase type II n=1 Tax=Acuticoccus sp. I52.16.1 TaxID=2928472 RepID=UPI001FD381A9|nr:haloacid dehalogenase type II [Acuticoccus sp. I52.16.1]UOM34335.1 haloacid dehalogenase type II [Acuticoccus sp. I52.16.1]